MTELIEAAARSGRTEIAADAIDRLSKTTSASGTDWALGVEARSRALLSEGDAAERLYREAIERLSRTRVRLELARAHLLYGEWLRRAGRRVDARAHLRTAHEMLAAMGAEAFAERARRELLATGETVRTAHVETRDELTAQEAQIARLASDGLTEPRDRRPAVHQPAHRRVAPAQGVHQARHPLPAGTRDRTGQVRLPRGPGLSPGADTAARRIASTLTFAASRHGTAQDAIVDAAEAPGSGDNPPSWPEQRHESSSRTGALDQFRGP